MDSAVIKFLIEGEWKCKKHGAVCGGMWRKVHLGIEAQILKTRAIEVTSGAFDDAPVLPELLAQAAPGEPVASVRADGAHNPQPTWMRPPSEERKL